MFLKRRWIFLMGLLAICLFSLSGVFAQSDMDMLEPGYQYGFKFSIYDDYTQSYLEQPYIFKFRVS